MWTGEGRILGKSRCMEPQNTCSGGQISRCEDGPGQEEGSLLHGEGLEAVLEADSFWEESDSRDAGDGNVTRYSYYICKGLVPLIVSTKIRH